MAGIWKSYSEDHSDAARRGRPRLSFCGHKHADREAAEACRAKWDSTGVLNILPGETGVDAWTREQKS